MHVVVMSFSLIDIETSNVSPLSITLFTKDCIPFDVVISNV